jgi:hypothetical protein
MPQGSIKIQCKIQDLRKIAESARSDYENLPDDESLFPFLTPMKELKLRFLTLSEVSNSLADMLSRIQKTGQIS